MPKSVSPPRSLEDLATSTAPASWHDVAWRCADGEKRRTRIAWQPVYALSDPYPVDGDWPQTWLVVDWPQGRDRPYHLYLAYFHATPTRQRCLRLSRGRFVIEEFFQRGKIDLGLDHYEGRSWRGFHHHLVLAAVAYLFVTLPSSQLKKTSSATWEAALRAIQPWLIRSVGPCPCCHPIFPPEGFDSS